MFTNVHLKKKNKLDKFRVTKKVETHTDTTALEKYKGWKMDSLHSQFQQHTERCSFNLQHHPAHVSCRPV